MDTTVAQWESSVNTIPKLPMGYKSPMIELALPVHCYTINQFSKLCPKSLRNTWNIPFICLQLSYANSRNDQLVEVPRAMPSWFRQDKTKNVNNQVFVMILQKNILQSVSDFWGGYILFDHQSFLMINIKLNWLDSIHPLNDLLNHKIRFHPSYLKVLPFAHWIIWPPMPKPIYHPDGFNKSGSWPKNEYLSLNELLINQGNFLQSGTSFCSLNNMATDAGADLPSRWVQQIGKLAEKWIFKPQRTFD